jgi:hypothetical protein
MITNTIDQLSAKFVSNIFSVIRAATLNDLGKALENPLVKVPTGPGLTKAGERPSLRTSASGLTATLTEAGGRFFLKTTDGRQWASTRRRVLLARVKNMGITLTTD